MLSIIPKRWRYARGAPRQRPGRYSKSSSQSQVGEEGGHEGRRMKSTLSSPMGERELSLRYYSLNCILNFPQRTTPISNKSNTNPSRQARVGPGLHHGAPMENQPSCWTSTPTHPPSARHPTGKVISDSSIELCGIRRPRPPYFTDTDTAVFHRYRYRGIVASNIGCYRYFWK